MHDTVDPGIAVRAGHLVVPHGDPRVLIGDAAAVSCEAAVHGGIVAWHGLFRRRVARRPRLPGVTDPDPRPASEPRHEVAVDWDARIPARDGVELSANIWRPLPRPHAPDETFPAILEMIPYGKDNWRRASDITRGEWFGARGYALCRVDVRGTGSSDGVAMDEYTADETRDGYDAVEWLAAQPWCDGAIGMWGISYGGFTAIQVAALRPPHLRAIVPIMATDDRYLDDVHYRGGCVTVSELSQYAVSQVAMNAMPPEATFRGAAWRDEWLARLDATPETFGTAPIVQQYEALAMTFAAGPLISSLDGGSPPGESATRLLRRDDTPEPATDDWPFLYLRERFVAPYYLGALAIIIGFAILL